ncbi:hypothetical protein CWR48_10105 [Oceanobacillus arenosus]|uniref:SH3b domain-containing protein n=1 Tax=Oceanobacillus arenosus TaxID=1229153 RepID=A0A3D8PU46_9BACI|nr:SH3 domain-containing protein [Oceanobacillus arenosus]RDW18669.1 hypothetical protein CWR48_10105 [Oceanobacillus arenosus]
MNKYKGLYIFILTIIALAFIVFVAFMQHNFTNPDFSASGTDPITTSATKSEASTESESTTGKEKESQENTNVATIEENDTVTNSTQVVIVSLLNVRSETDLDSDIVGVVTMDQELEVEDINNPDGWVKVTTDKFTGYVKGKFLEVVE